MKNLKKLNNKLKHAGHGFRHTIHVVFQFIFVFGFFYLAMEAIYDCVIKHSISGTGLGIELIIIFWIMGKILKHLNP